jgi:hypothetical protein
MNSPFNWQGQPSIFTQEKQKTFSAAKTQQHTALSLRAKAMPVALDGSSHHPPPKMVNKKGAKPHTD